MSRKQNLPRLECYHVVRACAYPHTRAGDRRNLLLPCAIRTCSVWYSVLRLRGRYAAASKLEKPTSLVS